MHKPKKYNLLSRYIPIKLAIKASRGIFHAKDLAFY